MQNTRIEIRYSLANNAPATLNIAEPAYSYNSNTLFIGTPDNAGAIAIGGKYYLDVLNSAFSKANASSGGDAYDKANAANLLAFAAYAQANTSNTIAVAAFDQANSGTSAAAAFDQANTAYDQANTVYTYSSNTVMLVANGAFDKANAANITADSAQDDATFANTVAIAAFDTANSGAGSAGAFDQANAAYDYANTVYTYSSNTVMLVANGAYDKANAANLLAYAALPQTGGTVSGDLAVSGNVTISGNVTYANTESLLIGDNIIELNADLPSDVAPTEDAGIQVNRGSADANTSVLWNETADEWQFTNDATTFYAIPTNTSVEFANTVAIAAFDTANSGAGSAGAFDQANAAYDFANTVNVIAVAAFETANSGAGSGGAYDQANAAYDYANTVYTYAANDVMLVANSAYDKANAANITADQALAAGGAAYDEANSATSDAATALTAASSAYIKANNTYTYAANNVRLLANTAYDKANNANLYADLAYDLGGIVYDEANSISAMASGASVAAGYAYDKANTANITADNAWIGVGAAYDKANAANITADTADTQSQAAFDQANTVWDSANTIYTYAANDVMSAANAAFAQANAANLVPVGNTISSNGYYTNRATRRGINFLEGTNVTINVDDDPTINVSNVTITATFAGDAGPAFDKANAANIIAEASFERANVVNAGNSGTTVQFQQRGSQKVLNFVEGTDIVINVDQDDSLETLNVKITSTATAGASASDAYNKANLAYTIAANQVQLVANSAYGEANVVHVGNTITSNGYYAERSARKVINFMEGENITITIDDDPTLNTANVTITGAAGGDPTPAFDKANLAYTYAANDAMLAANSAYDLANAAYTFAANDAMLAANAAYALANSNQTYAANTVMLVANTAYGLANSNYTFAANTVRLIANSAYDKANAANLFALSAYTLAGISFDKANTVESSIGAVSDAAGAAYNKANSANITADDAYAAAAASYGKANVTYTYAANDVMLVANTAYAKANAANITADLADAQSQAAFDQANTVWDSANSNYTYASNIVMLVANTAYDKANAANLLAYAALPQSGGTIDGDLDVTGNVTISGNITYANTETLLIGDNIIELNSDLPFDVAPTEDAGIKVNRGSSSNVFLLWDEGSDVWQWSDDNEVYWTIPSNTAVESAFNQANTVWDSANSNYTFTANNVMLVANSAYDKANAANITADVADAQSQAAFDQANTVWDSANSNYTYAANTVMLVANTAYDAANTTYTYAANDVMLAANAAYDAGNTNYTYAANDVMLAANSAYGTANVANLMPVANTMSNGYATVRSTRHIMNFLEGTNITITVDDDSAGDRSNVTITSTGGTTSIATSDTAPSSPNDGDLWWHTVLGKLLVYYDDGDTQQWVETAPGLVSANGSGSGTGDTTIAVAAFVQANAVWDSANGNYTYAANDAMLVANSAYGEANVINVGNTTSGTFTPRSKRRAINFLEGTGVTITIDDDAALNTANVTITAAGGDTTIAEAAFDQANTVWDSANGNYTFAANTVRLIANTAYNAANSNYTYAANDVMLVANSAYDKANAANITADVADAQSQAAFDRANSVWDSANSNYTFAANTVRLIANTAYDAGNTNYTFSANTVRLIANTAYDAGNTNYTFAANTVRLIANTAYDAANSNYTYAANNVMSVANSAYGEVNVAMNVGITTAGTFTPTSKRRALNFIEGSNITITIDDDADLNTANITITSTASGGDAGPAFDQANAAYTFAANDAMLAANSAYGEANVVNVGITTAGTFTPTSKRSAINFIEGAGVTIAIVDDPALNTANVTITATGGDTTIAEAAFDQANTVWDSANSNYTFAANTVRLIANSAFDKANSVFTYAANDVMLVANTAYDAGNTNYTFAANTVRLIANSAYDAANSNYTYAANNVMIAANSAFAMANAANLIPVGNTISSNSYYTNRATRRGINFLEGSGITINVDDDPAINVSNVTITSTGGDTTIAEAAFDQANTVWDSANSNYTFAANTVSLIGNSAFDQANTVWDSANSNYTFAANTVRLIANTAYDAGNTNYTYAANNVMLVANSAYAAGNSNYTYAANNVMIAANSAYAAGNSNYTYAANNVMIAANSAYVQANIANTLANTRTVNFIIDGGGSELSTGSKGGVIIDRPFNIDQWTLLADQSGSVVVDVQTATYSDFPTNISSMVGGGTKPTLSTAQKNQSAPASWTSTTGASGNVVVFNVDSVTTVTRVTVSLKLTIS